MCDSRDVGILGQEDMSTVRLVQKIRQRGRRVSGRDRECYVSCTNNAQEDGGIGNRV